MIILGIILLIIGFIANIAIIWTIGIIVLVIGVILALLGMTGHAIRGRRHYFLARRSQLVTTPTSTPSIRTAHLMRWRAEAEFLITMLPGSQALHHVMFIPAQRARTSLSGVVLGAPRCG